MKTLVLMIIFSSLVACTRKGSDQDMVDSTPVQEKAFEVSGVQIGYDQFDPYLCFQLVGGLYMVKNQYYKQKLPKLTKEKDQQRIESMIAKTNKVNELMANKSKEIKELRQNKEMPYEERAKKILELQVVAFDTLKHFEPNITKLCHSEAKLIKDKCYRMKDQSLFSKCYDKMGKTLNKKVLGYFNNNVSI